MEWTRGRHTAVVKCWAPSITSKVTATSLLVVVGARKKMYRDILKLDQHFVENTCYEFVQYISEDGELKNMKINCIDKRVINYLHYMGDSFFWV